MEKKYYDIDSLVQFIFLENDNDHSIDLVIDQGCSNSKELFFICVELLTFGLKKLYAGDDGKVDLKNITLEQISDVKKKLLLAKIDFEINVFTFDNKIDSDESDKILKYLLYDINQQPDNLPLNEYCFKIELDDRMYIVNFTLLNNN
jgi:hypothetical protein